jgi:hypothetical protein
MRGLIFCADFIWKISHSRNNWAGYDNKNIYIWNILLPEIGLTPGGSSTVHIKKNTQNNKMEQNTQNIRNNKNT